MRPVSEEERAQVIVLSPLFKTSYSGLPCPAYLGNVASLPMLAGPCVHGLVYPATDRDGPPEHRGQ